MLPRKLWFPTLALIASVTLGSLVSPAQSQSSSGKPAPVLVLKNLGDGVADLNGPWQFQSGDDPSWANPEFDDSSWTQITADAPWGAQGFGAMTGFAWYRLHLSIANGEDPRDLAVLITAVDDVYAIYWNGILIGQNGSFPPRAKPNMNPQPAQPYGLGKAGEGVLALRVWKAPLASNDIAELGGFEAIPVIGTARAIATQKAALDFRWLRSNQFVFGLNGLYFLVTLLGLLAWFRDRSQRLLFWMAGYTFIPVVRLLIGGLRLPISFPIAEGVLQIAIMFQDVSLWFLLLWLLKLQDNRRLASFTRNAAIVFAIAFSLDGLVAMSWGVVGWERGLQVADALLTIIFTPLEVMPLIIVAAAFLRRQRLEHSRILVAVFAFLAEMTYVLLNVSGQFKRYTHWTLDDKISHTLFTVNGNPINARLLTSVFLLLAIIYAVVRYLIDERRRQAALEQEFESARELQQVLVPDTLPKIPGFTVTSAYRPAQQVGGDFFQVIPIEDGSTLVVLGDVSGKGLKAAMAVSLIVGALRALAEDYPSPANLLMHLNRRLFGRLQGGFATCLIILLGPDNTCVIASAGHPAPYLNKHEIEVPGALPLGVSQNTIYVEREVTTRPGDHLALYTDGLLEARNRTGELYGFDRLGDLFSAPTNAAEATEAAVNFGQDDDITVLTLTRLTAGEESVAVHLTASLQS